MKTELDSYRTENKKSIELGLTSFNLSKDNPIISDIDKHSNKELFKNVKAMLADEKHIEDMVSIIEETCLWLKEKGINQWNPEKYLKKYDKKYFLNAILNKEAYIVTIEDCIIGTFLLKWDDKEIWNDDNNAGYLHHLTVRRNLAGKELGQIALDNAKNIVKANGKRYLRLDCKASNKRLNEYYIKSGFNFKGYFKLGSYKGSKYQIEV